jgi:hypothetical protein
MNLMNWNWDLIILIARIILILLICGGIAWAIAYLFYLLHDIKNKLSKIIKNQKKILKKKK